MIKLISKNTLDKIKIIENINRDKGADIVKLFLQEVAELKGERVPMQITGVENVNKALIERDERQIKEMADCIVLWLQMDESEKYYVGDHVENIWIEKDIKDQLAKSNPFLESAINYKIERTMFRFNRNYY